MRRDKLRWKILSSLNKVGSFCKSTLKFTIFSMYDQSLVSNPRDEMIQLVMGVLDLFDEGFFYGCSMMI